MTPSNLQPAPLDYQLTFEYSGTATALLDASGTILRVNRRFEQLTGYERSAIAGKLSWRDFVDQAEAARLERLWRESANPQGAREYEAAILTPKGKAIAVHITSVPVPGSTLRIATYTDITERSLTAQALAQSERKLSLHLEQTMFGVIEWSPELRVIQWNPAAERIFGFTKAEALGRSAFELIIPPRNRGEVEQVFAKLLSQAGGIYSSNQNSTKDGRLIFCEWCNTPLHDPAGRVTSIISMAADITERRQAEAELKASNAKSQAILAAVPDMLFHIDRAGTFIGYSGPQNDLYLKPADFIGKRLADILPTTVSAQFAESIDRAISSGQIQSYAYDMTIRGQLRHYEARLSPLGGNEAIVLVRDISERQRAEDELRTSEETLRTIFDSGYDALFIHDQSGRVLDVNHKMLELYEVDREQALDHQIFKDYSDTANDLELLKQRWARVWQGQTAHFEWKARKPRSGQVFDVEVALKSINYRGQQAILATVRDITKRKAAERIIQASEAKFRNLFENANDGIILLETWQDAAGQLRADNLDFNRRFEELLGATRAEIFEMDPVAISPPQQPDGRESYAKALDYFIAAIAGQPQFFEWQLVRRDGRPIETEISLSRIQLDEKVCLHAVVRDISARKADEQKLAAYRDHLEDLVIERSLELKESEEKYRTLVDNLPGAIFRYQPDGDHTIYISEYVLDITGYPASVFVEHPARPFFSIVHPDDRPALRRVLEQSRLNRQPYVTDYRIFDAQGRLHWVYEKAQGVYEGDELKWFDGALFDITDRKLAQETLKRRMEYEQGLARIAQILLDGAADAVDRCLAHLLRLSETCRVALIELKQAAETGLIANLRNEVCAVGTAPLLDDPRVKDFDLRASGLGHLEQAILTGQSLRERPGLSSEPSLLDELGLKPVMILPLRVGGKVDYLIGFEDAQTDRVWNDDDLEVLKTGTLLIGSYLARQRAKEKLREAKEEAETATRAKTEFLANMSHEIRTPMNAILGFTELLEGRIQEPELQRYLSSIRSSGRTLLGLINDILDLSKIEAGKLSLNPAPLDIRTVIDEVVQIFSDKTTQKGLDFDVNLASDLAPLYLLDEIRLRQILFNLVGNAVKFTDQGGISLKVTARPLTDGQTELGLSLTDTGIGIPADQLDMIFEAFEQRHGQDANRYGGTGLGLTITQKLTNMMGGTITVTSQPGAGSAFYVRIPTIVCAAQLSTPSSPPARRNFAAATVLIADDEASNRLMLSELLSLAGLTVIEAQNGQQALELARQLKPDLILLDMQMPIMDGYTAARQLKAEPATESIPIVAVTAAALGDQLPEACDSLMLKPFSRENLARELSRYLKRCDEPAPAVCASPGPRLSAEQRRQVAAVIRCHDEKLLNEWQQLDKPYNFKRIKTFGEVVRTLGQTGDIKALVAWAEMLLEQAGSFDMQNLPATLAAYPGLIKGLKNQME